MEIKWYFQYVWVKLNIFILTPIVWVQNKYDEYKEWRLRNYVEYMCMIDNIKR